MSMYTREEMTRLERIRHVKLIVEAHEWRQSRVNKTVHRNPQGKHYALLLWDAQVLNRSAIARLVGASRPTVYEWLPYEPGEDKRLRGARDFGAMRYLLTALQAREDGEELNWGQVTGDLRAAGVGPSLLRFLCGPDKTRMGAPRTYAREQRLLRQGRQPKNKKTAFPPPEEAVDDADDLRTEVRPDDQGHPDPGEEIVVNLHKDPVDHRSGHRTQEPEPDHTGHVRGAGPRTSDDDTEPAEGQGGVADNTLVDPATLSDADYIQALEDGCTWIQEGRMPFDIEPVDLDGDSYLEDLPHPPSSDGLAANFQTWEQAEDS